MKSQLLNRRLLIRQPVCAKLVMTTTLDFRKRLPLHGVLHCIACQVDSYAQLVGVLGRAHTQSM